MISASPLVNTEPAMPRLLGKRISPIALPCITREYSSPVSGSYRNSELRSAFSVLLTTSIRRGNSTSSERLSDTRLAMSATADVAAHQLGHAKEQLRLPGVVQSAQQRFDFGLAERALDDSAQRCQGRFAWRYGSLHRKKLRADSRIASYGANRHSSVCAQHGRSDSKPAAPATSAATDRALVPPRCGRAIADGPVPMRAGRAAAARLYQTRSLTWTANAPSKRFCDRRNQADICSQSPALDRQHRQWRDEPRSHCGNSDNRRTRRRQRLRRRSAPGTASAAGAIRSRHSGSARDCC